MKSYFKEKFNSFEGEVSPDAWANIQQGMASGAAGTTAATGMSLLMKGVIAGGIVAATVTSIYLFSDTTEQEVAPENNLVVNDQVENNADNGVIDQGVQNENLPENTVDGLSVSDENNAEQTADENTNAFENNIGPENNGAQISENNDVDNSTSSVDPAADNTVDNADNSTDNNPVDSDVQSPINDPKPGGLDVAAIVAHPTYKAENEFAPTTCTFQANVENARSVEWQFEDGTTESGEEVEYTFDKPGTYSVLMTAYGDGEPVSESIEVVIKSSSSINTLPNIITPNGDRKNDFFAISTTDIETFYIKITDLKGNTVFESTDVNFRWHGTNLGGEELPAGNYIYSFFAKGIDGTEFKKADQIKIKVE